MTTTYTKWPLNTPNGFKKYKTAIKYTKLLNSKALKNIPNLGKIYVLSGNPGAHAL
jgi:hypothetical protein